MNLLAALKKVDVMTSFMNGPFIFVYWKYRILNVALRLETCQISLALDLISSGQVQVSPDVKLNS